MKVFLVYGECVCGWRCCCAEGELWPQCPRCERQVIPPRPSSGIQRLAICGEIMDESIAVREQEATLVQSPRSQFPILTRYYRAEDLERNLEQAGVA